MFCCYIGVLVFGCFGLVSKYVDLYRVSRVPCGWVYVTLPSSLPSGSRVFTHLFWIPFLINTYISLWRFFFFGGARGEWWETNHRNYQHSTKCSLKYCFLKQQHKNQDHDFEYARTLFRRLENNDWSLEKRDWTHTLTHHESPSTE